MAIGIGVGGTYAEGAIEAVEVAGLTTACTACTDDWPEVTFWF